MLEMFQDFGLVDCSVSAELADTSFCSWTIFFACRRSGMSIMWPRNVKAPYKHAYKQLFHTPSMIQACLLPVM